jgi:hypothetical protein
MVAFSLDTLQDEPNVLIRFNWNDANNSTNGFALDDIYIGSMDDYSIANERLNYGNYVAPNFSDYNHSYTMIPINQAHAVSASSMVYNNGLQDAQGIGMNLQIIKDGQTLYSGQSNTLSGLGFLRKEYLTVQSDFIPSALGKSLNPADPTISFLSLLTASTRPICAISGSLFTLDTRKPIGLGPSTRCLKGLVNPFQAG